MKTLGDFEEIVQQAIDLGNDEDALVMGRVLAFALRETPDKAEALAAIARAWAWTILRELARGDRYTTRMAQRDRRGEKHK